jgi:hypothetical protein
LHLVKGLSTSTTTVLKLWQCGRNTPGTDTYIQVCGLICSRWCSMI